ncbi:SixA phosphatase family protein [Tepidamorphus sp. 3E244]|uniref:SixA phosphatase family protein n=1 Tax=Tepidamorphus sp. 3E244 TaxID=3385498 RepID=UPI0038FC20C9
MPKLVLMRHAKSDWDKPGLADFDRPLSPRGERTIPRVMAALEALDIMPDHVICSTALRTRQTLALALQGWKDDMRIDMTKAVYEAEAEDLIELVSDAVRGDAPETLTIIGHNPAMEDLAAILAGPGSDQEGLDRIHTKYPTAAVAVFDGSWDDFGPGRMKLETFIVPRELPEA